MAPIDLRFCATAASTVHSRKTSETIEVISGLTLMRVIAFDGRAARFAVFGRARAGSDLRADEEDYQS